MEKNQPVNPKDTSPGMKGGHLPSGSWSGAGANVKTNSAGGQGGKMSYGSKKSGGGKKMKGY